MSLAWKVGAAALGLVVLLAFAWVGAGLQRLGVPLPGTVLGLVLFAAVMAVPEHGSRALGQMRRTATPVCRRLLTHMGLLFVPAGVGVITQADLIRRQWAPIAAALVGSTVMTLVVTGWLMHRLARPTTPQS